MQQRIGHCTTPDGVRLAYADVGTGPVLVKTANWLNHLEFDWQSPVFRHYFRELAAHHRLIRYDTRGSGLSEWAVERFSLDAFVSDLETVVDALELDQFVLFGVSQGCAVSVTYAVRHPERVRGLVLLGGYVRGWLRRGSERTIEQRQALLALTRAGWGMTNAAFRDTWSSVYVPDGSPEHIEWWSELQRITTSPENAAAILTATGDVDVVDLAPKVRAPTLVMHSEHELAVPYSEGQSLARLIPGARFVGLNSRNHIVLENESAWPVLRREIRAFLDELDPPPRSASAGSAEGSPSPVTPRSVGAAAASDSAAAVSAGGLLATGGALGGALFGRLAEELQVSDPVETDPLLGATVGHYRVEGRIGGGGMGLVYRAVDQRLARPVALKFLPAYLSSDSRALDRFVREARSVSALNHPNICVLYEIGEHEGRPFLALEMLEGCTLAELARQGPVDADRLVQIAAAACEGLDAAHEAGIVHRDIKPANLFLTQRGHLKILDFGIAKLMPGRAGRSESGALTLEERGSLTEPGSTIGTMAYMSPEQVLGEELDERTDLFSLGAVLYELATGEHPFPGATTGALVDAILRRRPPPASEVRPDLDARLSWIIDRALRKERGTRYSSAAEMRQDLERLRRDRLSGSQRSWRRGSGGDRPRWQMVALTLLLVAATVLAAYLVGRGSAKPEPGSGVAPAETMRVAVLPFVGDAGVSDAYLERALPDELTTVLARAPELIVRPYSSSSTMDRSALPRKIAEQLGVDVLLRGRLSQREGALELSLEAVQTADDRLLWHDTLRLPAGDLVAMRRLLGERVRRELLPALGVSLQDDGPVPVSAEAYRLYLETLPALLDPEPNRAAIAKLERSVQLDPAFASTWGQLGRRRYVDSYYWGGGEQEWAPARAAIEQALVLDPDLLEARATLVELLVEGGSVLEAYGHARALVERRPRNGYAHAVLSVPLRSGGLLDQAASECARGRELDADDPQLRTCAWTYLWRRDFDRAAELASLASSLVWSNDFEARIALAEGRADEARRLWTRQVDPSAGRLRRDYLVACLGGSLDEQVTRRFRETFDDLLAFPGLEWKFYSAGLFVRCGFSEEALALLSAAIDGGFCVAPSADVDPLLAPLAGRTELEALGRRAADCRARVERAISTWSSGRPGAD